MAIQTTTVDRNTSVGQYVIPTEVISAAAQVQALAIITVFEALITGQTPTTQNSMTSPDFQKIDPAFQRQLLAETGAMKAAIDAAPAA